MHLLWRARKKQKGPDHVDIVPRPSDLVEEGAATSLLHDEIAPTSPDPIGEGSTADSITDHIQGSSELSAQVTSSTPIDVLFIQPGCNVHGSLEGICSTDIEPAFGSGSGSGSLGSEPCRHPWHVGLTAALLPAVRSDSHGSTSEAALGPQESDVNLISALTADGPSRSPRSSGSTSLSASGSTLELMPSESLIEYPSDSGSDDGSENGSADTPGSTISSESSEEDLGGSDLEASGDLEASSPPSAGSDLDLGDDPDPAAAEVPEEHLLHFECPEWTRSVWCVISKAGLLTCASG